MGLDAALDGTNTLELPLVEASPYEMRLLGLAAKCPNGTQAEVDSLGLKPDGQFVFKALRSISAGADESTNEAVIDDFKCVKAYVEEHPDVCHEMPLALEFVKFSLSIPLQRLSTDYAAAFCDQYVESAPASEKAQRAEALLIGLMEMKDARGVKIIDSSQFPETGIEDAEGKRIWRKLTNEQELLVTAINDIFLNVPLQGGLLEHSIEGQKRASRSNGHIAYDCLAVIAPLTPEKLSDLSSWFWGIAATIGMGSGIGAELKVYPDAIERIKGYISNPDKRPSKKPVPEPQASFTAPNIGSSEREARDAERARHNLDDFLGGVEREIQSREKLHEEIIRKWGYYKEISPWLTRHCFTRKDPKPEDITFLLGVTHEIFIRRGFGPFKKDDETRLLEIVHALAHLDDKDFLKKVYQIEQKMEPESVDKDAMFEEFLNYVKELSEDVAKLPAFKNNLDFFPEVKKKAEAGQFEITGIKKVFNQFFEGCFEIPEPEFENNLPNPFRTDPFKILKARIEFALLNMIYSLNLKAF